MSVELDPYTPEAICEALVRHTEIVGTEVFEKNYVRNNTISATVWCVVGPNAKAFRDMVRTWLAENSFHEDT